MVRASDVVSDDDVRAIVEKIRNQYLQCRRAFRGHDATDLDSNSFEFPVSDNDLDGEVVEVPEGSDYPRATKSQSTVSAAYTKYGVEVPITDEAVADSAVDVEMDVNEDIIRAEERRVESIAYAVLDGNTNSGGAIDHGDATAGVIEYGDITDARERAFSYELSLQDLVLIGSGNDMSAYLNMSEFTQASELGDFVVEQGILPQGDLFNQAFLGVAGDVPVYLENVGNIPSGEAFLVDTSNFGWESTRWDTEVSSYREEEKDQDVWKIRGRWDWVATQPDANVKIET